MKKLPKLIDIISNPADCLVLYPNDAAAGFDFASKLAKKMDLQATIKRYRTDIVRARKGITKVRKALKEFKV